MTSFKNDGFLSEELTAWTEQNLIRNEEWYSLFNSINRLCQRVAFEMVDGISTKKELIVAAIYLRIITTAQAVVILAEKGIVAQSRVLIRSLFEGGFVLLSLIRDDKIYERYLEQSTYQTYKSIHRIMQSSDEISKKLHETKNVFMENIVEEIKEKSFKGFIKEKGLRDIKVREFAECAESIDSYNTTYSFMSEAVHWAARDIFEEHFEMDSDYKVNALKWSLDHDSSKEMMFFIIEPILSVLKEVSNVFDIEAAIEISTLEQEYEKLSGELEF